MQNEKLNWASFSSNVIENTIQIKGGVSDDDYLKPMKPCDCPIPEEKPFMPEDDSWMDDWNP